MRTTIAWIVRGAIAALVSCAGGTETDNPATTLSDFASSACKNRDLDDGQRGLALASDAEGLQCVSWDVTERGVLAVRLLNFSEPCGQTYFGRAGIADGALELSVYKDTCAVLRCGACLFDFDFEVSGAPSDAPLRLKLGSAVCETQPTDFLDEVILPLDDQPSGIRCRPLERSTVERYGRERGACGERNMPCGDCQSVDLTSCRPGLTCSEVAEGDSRCLAACESEDDCQGGLTTCTQGLCQPEASFNVTAR